MNRNANKNIRPDIGPSGSLILNVEAGPEMQKGRREKQPFAPFCPGRQKGKPNHVDPTETF